MLMSNLYEQFKRETSPVSHAPASRSVNSNGPNTIFSRSFTFSAPSVYTPVYFTQCVAVLLSTKLSRLNTDLFMTGPTASCKIFLLNAVGNTDVVGRAQRVCDLQSSFI
jgi:hypothetical protein